MSSSSIDLSTYSLRLYGNGATSPGTTTALTGTLAAGESAYFKNTSSTLITGGTVNSAVSFSGDDAIALFDGTNDIDVFGVIGQDPGTSWSRTFANGNGTTEDVTLRRNSSIANSTVYWNPLEWDVFAVNTFDGLGTHAFSASANANYYSNFFMALTSNLQGSSEDNVCEWIGEDLWSILSDQYSFLPDATKDYFATQPESLAANDPGDLLLRYAYLRNNSASGLTLINFLSNSSNVAILNAARIPTIISTNQDNFSFGYLMLFFGITLFGFSLIIKKRKIHH